MEKKDLLIKVDKIPLSSILPGYKTPSKFTHAIVVEPKRGDQRIVNFCSEDYTLIRNSEIIGRVEEGLQSKFDITAKYLHRGYAKFYMDYIIGNKAKKVQKGDIVGAKIRVVNSYDGRLKFGYNFGLARLVCTNGMTSLEQGSKHSAMHTPQVVNKDMVEQMISQTETFLDKLPDLLKPYHKLIAEKFPSNEADIIKRMIEISEDTKYPKRKIPDAARIAIEEAKAMKLEMSQWFIYQGMNNVLNHATDFQMEHHRREDVDREIITKFLD